MIIHTAIVAAFGGDSSGGSTGDRLSVLFVHDAVTENGAVRTTLEVARRYVGFGHHAELHVLFPPGGEPSPPVPPGIGVTLATTGRVRARFVVAPVAARLIRACRRADVVVCGSEVGPGLLAGAAAARLAGTPYVTVVQADVERAIQQWMRPWARSLGRRAHRNADAVVCVSRGLAEEVVAAGISPEFVHVVPNGVDVDRIRDLADETPPLPTSSRPALVAVGRLSSEKGLDLLIRAHAEVRRSGIDHDVRLAGTGPEEAALRSLAADLAVADSVTFIGHLANPLPLVKSASAFVLPSRREGMPLALLEALALGVPVVATNCGAGVREILAEGQFGALVEVDSVDSLVGAISAHLRDPDDLRTRARAGSDQAGRFSLDRTAAGHLEVLRHVTGRRPAASAPMVFDPPEAGGADTRISVVVALYNGEGTIAEQLEALLAQEVDFLWELVISDNGSKDGSLQIVDAYRERFAHFRLVDSSDRPGLSHARNVGVVAASSSQVVFCDQDDEVAPGWLAAMACALASASFVAGRLEHDRLNEPWTVAVRGRPQDHQLMVYEGGPYYPFAFGCTLGIHRELHERVGGFDERFVRGAEDADYCWRLQQLGSELVFVPDAVTHYRFRHSLRSVYRQARDYGRSEALLYRVHAPNGLPRVRHPGLKAFVMWVAMLRAFLRARDRGGLGIAIWRFGQRVGRLRGSREERVLFP